MTAVESLRQLILRDLEEDGWSHDSDDTPTNETANDGSSVCDRQRPTSLETVLSFSTNEWEAEPEEAEPSDPEQPSVHVVRKGNVDEIVAVTKRETPSLHVISVVLKVVPAESESLSWLLYFAWVTALGEGFKLLLFSFHYLSNLLFFFFSTPALPSLLPHKCLLYHMSVFWT